MDQLRDCVRSSTNQMPFRTFRSGKYTDPLTKSSSYYRTRKRGNCTTLQFEASRSAAYPLAPPSGRLSCPKSALGPV